MLQECFTKYKIRISTSSAGMQACKVYKSAKLMPHTLYINIYIVLANPKNDVSVIVT